MPTYPTYKLGEIIDKVPFEFKVKQKEYLPKGKFPVVDQGQDLIGGFVDDKSLLVKTELPVIVFGDHTKAKKFIDFPFVAGADGTKIIKPKKDYFIEPKLFYWFLHCVKFPDKGYARHFQYLLKSDIAVPPLPTQHAIVTRIETLFAELDKAVQHLRTAQQQLKTYRQAVLNHWLNNDEGKWEMVKLGNIADVNTGSTPKRGNKDYWENGNIPWITSGETNNPYITKATEFITTKAIAETNCKIIAKGSLVIAMYGEGKTRGKCAELSIDATTNQALASITFTDSRMYKNFAKWFFEKNYEDMRMLSSGGVQPNLNLGIIKNMILPLPPLAEQQRIVKEIESRLSQATATETYIENALQQAEALRQSILKKAFSGELV